MARPLDGPEGPLKVTGRATYAAEARPEGLVHGVLCRAPRAGRITDHRTAALRDMPGVLHRRGGCCPYRRHAEAFGVQVDL